MSDEQKLSKLRALGTMVVHQIEIGEHVIVTQASRSTSTAAYAVQIIQVVTGEHVEPISNILPAISLDESWGWPGKEVDLALIATALAPLVEREFDFAEAVLTGLFEQIPSIVRQLDTAGRRRYEEARSQTPAARRARVQAAGIILP